MNKVWQKVFCLTALILIIGIVHPLPAGAQADVRSLIITSIDTSKFPDVSFTARVLNENGRRVSGLTNNTFIVSENNQSVNFDINEVRIGTQAVVVLDVNGGITRAGGSGARQYDEMLRTALLFIQKMSDGDETSLVLIRPEGISTLHEFTSDKNDLSTSINQLAKDIQVNSLTNTLDAVDLAIQKLKDVPGSQKEKTVLVISPGIFSAKGGTIPTKLKVTTDLANRANISINTILVRGSNQPSYLDQLAGNTHGLYSYYTGDPSVENIWADVDAKGKQYQFTFRSALATKGDRSLVVSLNGSQDSLSAKTYAVDPAPMAPEIALITVNNNTPVRRVAPKWDSDLAGIQLTEVQVNVNINWSDKYPRKLTRAELWIDNQQFGAPIINPSDDFFFVWDIRRFTNPGTTTSNVEIRIADELGMTASQSVQVSVEVSIPEKPIENIFCSNIKKLPVVGESLSRSCEAMGLTPSQVINFALVVVLFILVVVLWFKRGVVTTEVKKVSVAVTDMVNRITQRTGGKKAKARLEALEGIEPGQRKLFDLYGETPIGRDRQLNVLVFASYPSISREHCIIHENKVTGAWTIEDRESGNGTFVNGEQVEAFVKDNVLCNNDIIELAQTERGGIKFKFTILSESNPDSSVYGNPPKAVPESSDESGDKDVNVRITQRIPRAPRPSATEGPSIDKKKTDSAKPDNDFDPSQQEF